jgi:hypothetical protein
VQNTMHHNNNYQWIVHSLPPSCDYWRTYHLILHHRLHSENYY